MFSRFAVLAVEPTAQQDYDRSTFHRRGNNAVTQDPFTDRLADRVRRGCVRAARSRHLKSDRHHSSQGDCCEDSAAYRQFGFHQGRNPKGARQRLIEPERE
jgi:hypothetical protein